jgi:hypothetical protein
MRAILGVALLALVGCAGTPIGDAMTGPEKLAEQDDAYCRSIGAVPNTQTYVQCRMFATQQRQQSHARARANASASLAQAGANMQANNANRTVNCTSRAGVAGTVQTSCY